MVGNSQALVIFNIWVMLKMVSAKIETIEKAKLFLVTGNDEVLVFTRSQKEETRQGGHDLVGGTLNEGEDRFSGAIRETGEEAKGIKLQYIRFLLTRPKMKTIKSIEAGTKEKREVLVLTHLLAATFELERPEDGIDGIELSDEHDDVQAIPRVRLQSPEITLPGKYKLAARVFEPVFAELVTLSNESNVVNLDDFRQPERLAA